MADHLRLGEPTRLATRRKQGGPPDRAAFDRREHAAFLARRLAGLGLPHPGISGAEGPAADADDIEDSRLVFVFTETGALKDGPFRRWHMTPVAEGSDRTYMVISNAESRRVFAELVGTYGGDPDGWNDPKSWQEQLDAITGVRLYGRQDRADERLASLEFLGTEAVDVLLWPSTLETHRGRARTRVAAARLQEIRDLVERFAEVNRAVHILAEDPRPDSTMVRVAATAPLLDALLEHPVVERVRPPLQPEVTESSLASANTPSQQITATGEPVGVIDDLVTDNPLLAHVVLERAAMPPGHSFREATDHGTLVAGVAAYGDLRSFATGGALPTPRPIFGARIMERNPASPDRALVAGLFHEQLEQAIRWLHTRGVRVITCSINDTTPDNAATPPESMAIIDGLVRELNLVVVLSAGNVRRVAPAHWLNDYPGYLDRDESRIADPGGAALAITVGARSRFDVPTSSSTTRPSRVAIARAGQPAPFTRTGPARGRGSGSVKPEFVAHGGNFAWDHGLDGVVQRDPNMSVVTTAPAGGPRGRILALDDGTSMAAPYVANQVAAIATRYPDAGANMLRALTALAGEHGVQPTVGSAVISAYGEPLAERVLESGPHRTILLYEGTIPSNTSLVHRLPVPEAFATGKYQQRIQVALAFDPPVRRSRRDYVASEMTFDFVRNIGLENVVAAYSSQPTEAEITANPMLERHALPQDHQRPAMKPSLTQLTSNTLIRRSFDGGWDPDDDGYFLVVKHRSRPWASSNERGDQSYAIAVELSLATEARIDLRAEVSAELQARVRARATRRPGNER